MSDRKNIKVGEDLFERMKADKGPHKSWPQYFEDQLSEDAGGAPAAVDADAIAASVTDDLLAQLPPKIADELR